MVDNDILLEYVRDITTARLTGSQTAAAENGDEIARFMQKIYDKLSELNKDNS